MISDHKIIIQDTECSDFDIYENKFISAKKEKVYGENKTFKTKAEYLDYDKRREYFSLFNLKSAVDLGGRPQAMESIEVVTASHFTNLVTTALSVTAYRHKTWAGSESSNTVFRFNKPK